MTEGPPSVQRRRFLTAAGTTTLAGVAGCSALTETDDPDGGDIEADGPAGIVEQYFRSVAEQRRRRNELFHSSVGTGPTLESVETTVVEEELSVEEFVDTVLLSRSTAEAIATEEETAVVESRIELRQGEETIEEVAHWVVATEDGDWRLVEETSPSEPPTDPDTESEPEPGPAMPDEVHTYMIDNEVNLYDGTVTDRTGRDSVTVQVGAGEIAFGFSPPVVRLDAGTEVVWEWTGEGGAHNVETLDAPEAFSSGEPVAEDGYTWSYTFETPGTYFYSCLPHRATGMHGAVIVEG